jgi:hypothetical protein
MSEEKGKQDPPSKTAMERWEEIAEELPFGQLERVRTSADKWLTTISALTGLTSLLTLLASGETTRQPTDVPQFLVGAFLALAFISAISAIYLGALAAQGGSTKILNDPLEVRNWYRDEAAKAANHLLSSRRFALAAAILVGLSTFVAWYGPDEQESMTSAIITLQSGTILCKTILTDANGNVVFDLGTLSNPIQNVSSLQLVEECP